jgi:hypothetical protein
MAMNRIAAPWWTTWALTAALLAIFLGERPLADETTYRWLLTGVGTGFVLCATVWRLLSWLNASGDRRRVERILLVGYLGITAALALYFAKSGLTVLGVIADRPPGAATGRAWTIVRVLWPILLAGSYVPTFMAQLAIGSHLAAAGAKADDGRAEAHRVAQLAVAGLSISMGLAFLFLSVYIASERDKKVDLSYFRTSSPGSAVKNGIDALGEPIEVLLFFPEVNEVKDEVKSYFDELAGKTSLVSVRDVDQLVDKKLAEKHRVREEGTILMLRGDQSHTITLGTELNAATRKKLRELDSEVQAAFMKIAREARTAYFIIGHHELNDPSSPLQRHPLYSVTAIRDILKLLNYRVKDLGLRQGLAQEVPDDATLVLLLGPQKPLLDEELAALDRYLAHGGALLAALEPGTEVKLGPLEGRLGVSFNAKAITDDKQFFPQRRNASDFQNIITDQFSAHASVTRLSRAEIGAGLLFLGSGSLDDAGWAEDWGAEKPKRTYVIKSMASSYRDENGDFAFDKAAEKRQSYNLIAAIEGPTPPAPPDAPEGEPKEDAPGAEGKDAAGAKDGEGAKDGKAKDGKAKDGKDGKGGEDSKAAKDAKAKDGKDKKKAPPRPMRAIVITDAQLLSDGVLARIELSRDLLLDVLKWAGGEEAFAGEVKSEADKPITHTQSQDILWYYSTILGAPALVLGFGLLGVSWRRRRQRGRVS